MNVVMFSGGIGSYAAAARVAALGPTTLLFADTQIEDEDLYRFLDQAAAHLGLPLERVADGRDPWQVFHDSRFLGNHRVDPCSRILKRELMRRWVEERYQPDEARIVLGIDWSEAHRFERAAPRWAPYEVVAPLCDPPYQSKVDQIAELRAAGIEPPRLYALGFPHNNCGGFCIKAGQAHFKLLLERFPERYRYHERREQELREYLGKDVAILTDRSGGRSGAARRPMTLREFRERVEAGGEHDQLDFGGCGCVA